jgi:hypothetical protein
MLRRQHLSLIVHSKTPGFHIHPTLTTWWMTVSTWSFCIGTAKTDRQILTASAFYTDIDARPCVAACKWLFYLQGLRGCDWPPV